MKTLNLRICAALLTACLLFPALGGKAGADTPAATPAAAPTVTLTMQDSPCYVLSVPDAYRKVKTGADGKITVRALLTLYLLRIPNHYGRADGPTPIEADGRLGRDFRQDPRALTADDYDPQGRVKGATPGNETLFNTIRDFIPRTEQSDENGTSLLARALNPAGGKTAGIKNADYAFAFGDSLDNARIARRLALQGNGAVDTGKFKGFFKKADGIQLLTDPDAISSSSPGEDPLSQTSFQNDGRWYFDKYNVTDADLPDLTSMPMMEVRVVWALEATFDPASPPELPLINITPVPAAGGPGQTVAASSQPTPPALGLPGLLGFTGTQISAIGTPNQTPGLDIVGGITIRDNDTSTLLGVNLTPAGKKPSAGLTDRVLDFNRLGVLVGRTTDAQPAYVTALSLKVNSNALLYVGPAFSNSGGLTRSGISFGAAFNLLPLLGGNQPAAPSQAGRDVEVDLVQSDLTVFPRKKDTQAAILWTTPPDLASAVDIITPTFKQGAASYGPSITFPRMKNSKGSNQFFWLQFVNPGTLTDVTSPKSPSPDYAWSDKNLFLLQMIEPKVLGYDTSKNLDIAASQAYNIQVTTVPPTDPPVIARTRPLPGQPHLSRSLGVRPLPVTAASLRPLAVRRVSSLTHRPILMHRRMPSNTAMTADFVPGALADPPAAPPLSPAAVRGGVEVRGGATDLTGAISPPAGVSLDQITLELRDAPSGRVLMSAQLPFIHDRKPDHFRWPISRPGVYYLCITANGRRLSAPKRVSPGTALGWVDIN